MKQPKKNGRYILGNATKVTDRQRAAGLDLDFIITTAKDMWQEMTALQREAYMDHELCHCDFKMGYARMRDHDIEEFHCIVERYGLWKPDLAKFGEAIEQHLLPGLEMIRKPGAVIAVTPEVAEMAEA